MGHIHKSKYVGNHGGAYVDINGQSKQFTYVDHDPKTKISTTNMSTQEKETIKSELATYRASLITKISVSPPSLCPNLFEKFTLRGDREAIEWDVTALNDAGVPLQTLSDLWTLLSKRVEAAQYTY